MSRRDGCLFFKPIPQPPVHVHLSFTFLQPLDEFGRVNGFLQHFASERQGITSISLRPPAGYYRNIPSFTAKPKLMFYQLQPRNSRHPEIGNNNIRTNISFRAGTSLLEIERASSGLGESVYLIAPLFEEGRKVCPIRLVVLKDNRPHRHAAGPHAFATIAQYDLPWRLAPSPRNITSCHRYRAESRTTMGCTSLSKSVYASLMSSICDPALKAISSSSAKVFAT